MDLCGLINFNNIHRSAYNHHIDRLIDFLHGLVVLCLCATVCGMGDLSVISQHHSVMSLRRLGQRET